MNNQNISQLYSKLTELVDAGDEKAVRDFLTEHIKEFPEDVQKKIIFDFFEDALDKKIESDTQNAQIQKEGIDTISDIEKTESKLNDLKKVGDVRASLGI